MGARSMAGRTPRFGPEHVTWSFEAGQEAAYLVDPGTVFVVETLDALGGAVRPGMTEKPAINRANPATGPIAVRGATPGQVLAVDILSIDLVGQGYVTFEGKPRFFNQQGALLELYHEIRLPLCPMIGTIGVAPAEGSYPNMLPGVHGGNMDTRDVAAGATIYLTIQVDDALLAMGDVHATQGDGETSGQGVETSAEVTVRARLLPSGLSSLPYLIKGGELMVVASAESMEEASRTALEEMARIVTDHSTLAYDEVRIMLGQIGDLRVGQIVNPLKTMRMALPIATVPWRAPLPT